MFQDTISLAAMADALSLSPDYRVLRRLAPRLPYAPSTSQDVRTAVLLDTETTGLDARKDEIIELGMVKFDYLPDGRIAGVTNTFSAFNEPTLPIPAEVIALTGITDELVAGHRIDEAAVNAFVDDAAIVIAHNSGFDRKFAERYWPVFEQKAWGCSATEVEWKKHGFAGAQLGYLLNGAGFFHNAHRAVDDCHALLEVLAFELPTTGAPALALLLETARKPTVRVWAEQSPFELKHIVRGFVVGGDRQQQQRATVGLVGRNPSAMTPDPKSASLVLVIRDLEAIAEQGAAQTDGVEEVGQEGGAGPAAVNPERSQREGFL